MGSNCNYLRPLSGFHRPPSNGVRPKSRYFVTHDSAAEQRAVGLALVICPQARGYIAEKGIQHNNNLLSS